MIFILSIVHQTVPISNYIFFVQRIVYMAAYLLWYCPKQIYPPIRRVCSRTYLWKCTLRFPIRILLKIHIGS